MCEAGSPNELPLLILATGESQLQMETRDARLTFCQLLQFGISTVNVVANPPELQVHVIVHNIKYFPPCFVPRFLEDLRCLCRWPAPRCLHRLHKRTELALDTVCLVDSRDKTAGNGQRS